MAIENIGFDKSRSPLVNGKTFATFRKTMSGTSDSVRFNSPVKKAIKHLKSNVYPGYSRNYHLPMNW